MDLILVVVALASSVWPHRTNAVGRRFTTTDHNARHGGAPHCNDDTPAPIDSRADSQPLERRNRNTYPRASAAPSIAHTKANARGGEGRHSHASANASGYEGQHAHAYANGLTPTPTPTDGRAHCYVRSGSDGRADSYANVRSGRPLRPLLRERPQRQRRPRRHLRQRPRAATAAPTPTSTSAAAATATPTPTRTSAAAATATPTPTRAAAAPEAFGDGVYLVPSELAPGTYRASDTGSRCRIYPRQHLLRRIRPRADRLRSSGRVVQHQLNL